MERLSVRYAALACVIAGGLLVSGPGVVAFADEPGTGGDDGGTNSGGGATTPAAEPGKPQKWPVLRWLSTVAPTTPKVGPVAPPEMNLPTWLTPGTPTSGTDLTQTFILQTPNTAPAPGSNPQWVAVTMSEPEQSAQQGSASATMAPDGTQAGAQTQGQSQTQDETRKSSPTLSFLPLVPPGVSTGPGITLTNPLPDELPIDLHKAFLPQVLPPPLVMILMAAAEQVPFAGLVINPLLEVKAPPFIADVLIPALLSDIVVPTFALGDVLPTETVPTTMALTARQSLLSSLPGSTPPPREIAPMGMDVPLAPPTQPTPPSPSNTPQPQQVQKRVDSSAGPVSEQVAYRAGYSDYLRNAGMGQITAVAVPGAVAILLFTVGGGFIGYRQARAGHVIRAEGIGRFLR